MSTACDDNCPVDENPLQEDQDSDGAGDACDNCPTNTNADQSDMDLDTIGDACDDDKDGDGVGNAVDNCPDVANPGQEDADSDGTGDACTEDSEVQTEFWDVEPNDSFNAPQVLGVMEAGYNYRLTGDTAPGDDDIFVFQVEEAGTFKFQMSWPDPSGSIDLDVQLLWLDFDSGQIVPAEGSFWMGATIANPEFVMIDVEPGKVYGILVSSWAGSTYYTLQFGYDFEYEEEPNDWPNVSFLQMIGNVSPTYWYNASQQFIRWGKNYLGELEARAAEEVDDWDSYFFTPTFSGTLTATLNWEGSGTLAIQLADYTGGPAWVAGALDTFTFPVVAGNSYIMAVLPVEDDISIGEYNLHLQIEQGE